MKKRICFFCMAFAPLLLWGQTYNSDLAKAAKKGDIASQRDLGICYYKGAGVNADDKKAYKWLSTAANAGSAEAMYYLATMYEQGRVKNSTPELAWDWYERAATGGDVNAQMKMAHKLENESNPNAIDWYLKAAQLSNAEAQYKCGLFAYQLYKSSGAEPMTTKEWNTAKDYFQKATAQGYSEARHYLSEITQTEQTIEAEKARLRAIEQARRDSLQRVQAEQQRKQDSIDIASGRKLPPRSWLVESCNLYTQTMEGEKYDYAFNWSNYYKKLKQLCDDDFFSYMDKSNMDELDRSLYMKSDQYSLDLSYFKKKKKEKYAIPLPCKPNLWEYFADGFSYYVWDAHNMETQKISKTVRANYIEIIGNLLIPINPSKSYIRGGSIGQFFKLDNLEKLQKLRSCRNAELIYIFSPSCSIDISNDNYKRKVYLTEPIGLYVVDSATGKAIADLTFCLRKPRASEEKKRMEGEARRIKAANKPKYHQQAKQFTCSVCYGQGYTEASQPERINGAWVTKKYRCTHCYGKGYTMEHYY